jgi:hypothetical protein
MSPSDFYLFGNVKSVLIGREIPDEIDLLEPATEILNGISMRNCNASFEARSNALKG